MGIIAFIILGLLAGLIAKAIMPGNTLVDSSSQPSSESSARCLADSSQERCSVRTHSTSSSTSQPG
jgi:hypothetical protein